MRRRARQVLGGVIAAALAALSVALLTDRPADAATTRHASLTVTGLVADGCPASTGGSQIFIKPGDTVQFKSSLAGINVGALSSVLSGLLPGFHGTLDTGDVTAFDSSLTWASDTKHPVDLPQGKTYSRRFPSEGVYNFAWRARSVTVSVTLPLLGTKKQTIALSQNIGGLVGADSALSWSGQVIVSTKSIQCGLSAQVPGVSVQPSVGKHKLPPVTLPGGNLPTVSVPTGVSLPTGKKSSTTTSRTNKSSYLDYTPHGPGVKERVMPQGGGQGGGAGGVAYGAPGSDGQQGTVITKTVNGKKVRMVIVDGKTVQAQTLADPQRAEAATKLPVVWVLAALIMLSAATASYARRFIAARH